MNDPRERQERFNEESFEQWEGFEGHRRRVSGMLAGGLGRLCVLGAGNCNDLDLRSLLGTYREVHLVDLDIQSLGRGVERQGVSGREGLVPHGNLDVTGMVDAMARWSPLDPVDGADLEAMVDWPSRRVGLALPGPFDVVASTCLLSQLIGNAHHAIGEAHPQLEPVVRAIRLGHLRLLASLTRPGGRVVLITDFATSERCPEIEDGPDSPDPGLIDRLAAEHGLIRGVHPVRLENLFRRDPVLSTKLDRVRLSPPWRWRLHSRTYLVCTIEAWTVAGTRS